MSATELWVNNDGMEVRFGSEQGASAFGGAVNHAGVYHEAVLDIQGTKVPATDAPIDKNVHIPSGSFILDARIIVDTAFTSGGSATLDIGLMNDDGDGTFSTNDDNGIDAAIAVGTLVLDYDVAADGAQIGTSPVNGTSTSYPLVFSHGYNTAAFTAGRARVIVRWIPPKT